VLKKISYSCSGIKCNGMKMPCLWISAEEICPRS